MSFKGVVEWPYELRYGTVNRVETDVLVIGGGIAGPWAAIEAARRGTRVTLIEESDNISSGPSGCDHWGPALDNPCAKITPDEYLEIVDPGYRGYINGIMEYINCNDGYRALLELEKMGGKIRDDADEFKGAPFRDEDTKLLFAYDYENRHTLRVWGQTFKLALYGEMLRSDVELINRVYATGLLTEGGKQGARVVGATAVNVRTGEYYVFKAKATVLCTGKASDRPWLYSGYRINGLRAPNLVGSGFAMAWRAGAELTQLEGKRVTGISRHPAYGTGNPRNTWYPCTIVDANGKEIPYISLDGKTLTSFDQRVKPSTRGKRIIMPGIPMAMTGKALESDMPVCLSDRPEFEELVRKGEYKLPLYADLTSMSEYERKAIFGLMVAQEGKTWIVYRNLTQAGFDPDKDLLQYYGDWFSSGPSLDATSKRGWTMSTGSGLIVDWDLKTTLDGFYGAGDTIFGSNFHSAAATGGRWAGAKAAEYAKHASSSELDESQVQQGMTRIYAPTERTEGIDWKDLNTGISSVLRTYFGEYVNEELLEIGQTWLRELESKEAKELVASNPHELMRSLETLDLLTVSQIIIESALSRKASSKALNLRRLDYSQDDPTEWNKFVTLKQADGKVVVGEHPFGFWLMPPYAPTYRENYEEHKPW
ncbi:MAG: FAD-dependent oxidoreductase [Candidatus Bathyarchaeia archaeon]|jgi:succinate dehydrogenase/fumarate reductase flavoprotein subunit